jgi:hypothetical protein
MKSRVFEFLEHKSGNRLTPPLVKSCQAQTHRGGTRHIRPLSYGTGLHSILLKRWVFGNVATAIGLRQLDRVAST